VWWTIYTWDRFASITYGRPLGINDKDCNLGASPKTETSLWSPLTEKRRDLDGRDRRDASLRMASWYRSQRSCTDPADNSNDMKKLSADLLALVEVLGASPKTETFLWSPLTEKRRDLDGRDRRDASLEWHRGTDPRGVAQIQPIIATI
jgi:hypothetical protein